MKTTKYARIRVLLRKRRRAIARSPLFSNTANILSLLGVVIAVIYGWIGWRTNDRMEKLAIEQVRIAKEQSKSEVRIDRFNDLLSKTADILTKDSEIVSMIYVQTKLLTEQLKSSSGIQSDFNNDFRLERKGELMRFIGSLTSMAVVAREYTLAKGYKDMSRFDTVTHRRYILDQERRLLESQMGAKILILDTNIHLCWLRLYENIVEEQANTIYESEKDNIINYNFGDGGKGRFMRSMDLMGKCLDTLYLYAVKQIAIIDKRKLRL